MINNFDELKINLQTVQMPDTSADTALQILQNSQAISSLSTIVLGLVQLGERLENCVRELKDKVAKLERESTAK